MLHCMIGFLLVLARQEVMTFKRDDGSGHLVSGSGTGSLGDEHPSSGTGEDNQPLMVQHFPKATSQRAYRPAVTRVEKLKALFSKQARKSTVEVTKNRDSASNANVITRGLDSVAAMAKAYRNLLSFLSKQKQWKRTEIRQHSMSLPQILALLAPRVITNNEQEEKGISKTKMWPATPYYLWRMRKNMQLFQAKKHQVTAGQCVGENELCDASQDEQCCGYASYCVDYFGVSKCLTFVRLSSEDLHDSERIERNNQYKKYIKSLLELARYQLKYELT